MVCVAFQYGSRSADDNRLVLFFAESCKLKVLEAQANYPQATRMAAPLRTIELQFDSEDHFSLAALEKKVRCTDDITDVEEPTVPVRLVQIRCISRLGYCRFTFSGDGTLSASVTNISEQVTQETLRYFESLLGVTITRCMVMCIDSNGNPLPSTTYSSIRRHVCTLMSRHKSGSTDAHQIWYDVRKADLILARKSYARGCVAATRNVRKCLRRLRVVRAMEAFERLPLESRLSEDVRKILRWTVGQLAAEGSMDILRSLFRKLAAILGPLFFRGVQTTKKYQFSLEARRWQSQRWQSQRWQSQRWQSQRR